MEAEHIAQASRVAEREREGKKDWAKLTLSVEISNTHPLPIPGDGEALIKLEFSGVCHSDVHSIRGDTPMSTDVAGHEGIGKVMQGLRYPMALNMRNNHD